MSDIDLISYLINSSSATSKIATLQVGVWFLFLMKLVTLYKHIDCKFAIFLVQIALTFDIAFWFFDVWARTSNSFMLEFLSMQSTFPWSPLEEFMIYSNYLASANRRLFIEVKTVVNLINLSIRFPFLIGNLSFPPQIKLKRDVMMLLPFPQFLSSLQIN